MRSVVRWTCRSERSEDRNVHRPERSSALRSLDERTAALPTERVPPVQQRLHDVVIILFVMGRFSPVQPLWCERSEQGASGCE